MTGFSALPATGDEESGAQTQWLGTANVLGPKWLKMPILTVGMMGLQIIWSVEMSYASPYLISLGLSRSLMSIVFLAGPLSGLIVQPLIGVLSDGSHSRFGRRRPYIFFGLLISFAGMYLFGFTRVFASIITPKGSPTNNALTIAFAVLSIYFIDFSINAVQAMDRALLVDVLPVSQQERGNAWAGRMFGLGSVIGFFAGNVDLTVTLPFLGNTQLEVLCVVTSAILVITHFITLFYVKERRLQKPTTGSSPKFSLWKTIKDIWTNFFGLPGTIKNICLIQLFAWIGWFPVLFWTSLYVGGLHKRNSATPVSDDARAALEAEATRLGSRALLCNAVASLVASVICPFFVSGVQRSQDAETSRRASLSTKNGWLDSLKRRWRERGTCHLAILWAASHGIFAVCMLSTFFIRSVATATVIMTLSGFSWAVTQWAPFALIAEAIHWASVDSSNRYVIGDAGLDSDMEEEAIPLRDTRTIIASGEEALGSLDESRRLILEINEDDSEEHAEGENNVPIKTVHFEDNNESHPIRASKDLDDSSLPSTGLLGVNPNAQQSRGDLHMGGSDTRNADEGYPSAEVRHDARNASGRSIEDKAGIILGIHNVFIVIPQFIITGLSSILFALMDSQVSVPQSAPAHPGTLPAIPVGNNTTKRDVFTIASTMLPRAEGEATTRSADSVAVIFRIGGVSAAIACVLALRLARELKRASR